MIFIAKIECKLEADTIDDALNILGHHLIIPDDEAYQLLPNSEIDIHPLTEEGHA